MFQAVESGEDLPPVRQGGAAVSRPVEHKVRGQGARQPRDRMVMTS